MAINQLDMSAVFNNALGTVAAHRGMQQQQEYRNFLRDNGEALMAGDPGALAGYAQYDPGGALSMRNNMNSERRAADLYKRQVAEFAANKSAAELQAEIQKTDQILMGAAHFYESKDPQGYAAFLSQNGIDPQKYPFKQFPAYARQYKGARDVLAGVLERQAPKGPLSAPGKVQHDIDNNYLPAGTELRSPQVVVNTGSEIDQRPITDKPPKGYQRRYDAGRGTWVDEPIPGSEVATDAAKGEDAASMATAAYNRKFKMVDDKLTEAIGMLDKHGRWVSGYGSKLSALPETSARDFQATLDTIKANLGFEELQAMRDASPTGGALGQVSEREIAFLQAMQGNLDAAQSPDQLKSVLTEIQRGRQEFATERARILNGGQSSYTPEAIMGMSEREIVEVPIEEMGPEQLDALEQRYNQLKAGK